MSKPRHEEFLTRFTKAQPLLRRFVLAHVPDFHEAEDTLQKISLVLWEKFSEYDPTMSFGGWAFGVARREVLRSRRTSARMRVVLSGDLETQFEDRLQESAPDFEERRAFLEKCLGQLPEKVRRTIDMHYGQGLSSEQAAASAGMTVNALRIMLCRGRKLLNECMQRDSRQGAGDGGLA